MKCSLQFPGDDCPALGMQTLVHVLPERFKIEGSGVTGDSASAGAQPRNQREDYENVLVQILPETNPGAKDFAANDGTCFQKKSVRSEGRGGQKGASQAGV